MADKSAIDKLDTTPLDASELQPCAHCKKGMLHSGAPVFYELTIRQCVADMPNIQRMHGMEMMMGGNVGIARALSPSNTVAHRIGQPHRLLVCMDCSMQEKAPAAFLMELADNG